MTKDGFGINVFVLSGVIAEARRTRKVLKNEVASAQRDLLYDSLYTPFIIISY